MAIQIVAVPLYSADMSVEAYVFRYQKGNPLFSSTQAINVFDGGARSQALDILDIVGLDAFTLGKPIFVPLEYINLMGNFVSECKQPRDKIIFLFENVPDPDGPYVPKIAELYDMGFHFAVSYLNNPEKYGPILQYCSHYFLSQRPENAETSKRVLEYLKRNYRRITPIANHIRSPEMMKELSGAGYTLYESRFFKISITKGDHNVSPLKANSIRLLNTVQDENFDFENVAAIVQSDPALTISLLRIVNAPNSGTKNKIRTIPHAVAVMGQKEVRKWVTTAVSQSLGDDKPNEITRISLIRAKFAENLAPLYDMANFSQELFLMGLFSVLDIILDLPMPNALDMVHVSDMIRKALVEKGGLYYPILNMVEDYENAFWSSVSRQMIMNGVSEDNLANAYLEALIWYRNLIEQGSEEETPTEPPA